MLQCYALQKNVVLKFFSSDGVRFLYMSKHNARNHKRVREKYVQRVLRSGIFVGVRGAPWVLASDEQPPVFYLMSYATLAESVYEAALREPENKFVKISLENGIPGAIIFNARTPADVLTYLKELHNDFHAGVDTSFLEIYLKIEDIEASWLAHAKDSYHCYVARPLYQLVSMFLLAF